LAGKIAIVTGAPEASAPVGIMPVRTIIVGSVLCAYNGAMNRIPRSIGKAVCPLSRQLSAVFFPGI
jgi:hypothetical protein